MMRMDARAAINWSSRIAAEAAAGLAVERAEAVVEAVAAAAGAAVGHIAKA